MKSITFQAFAFITLTDGFPFVPQLLAREASTIEGLARPYIPHHNTKRQVASAETNCGVTPCNVFSAQDQFVDVRDGGPHQFVPSTKYDIRGLCPGLNAAANHGFLPHNGIATIAQAVDGLGKAFNMGPDLAAVLATYSIVLDGDPGSGRWSIGGPFPGSLLSDIGGMPQGISYSHNDQEGDASATRGDAYLYGGDAHSLRLDKFEHLYNLAESYTIENMQGLISTNQNESISTNPYYFSNIFSGLLIVPAAHYFIVNFFSNHSAAQPNGYLDRSTLKSFFAVSGEPGSFVWNKGQERIPANWYRRPSSNPYDVTRALADILVGYSKDPGTLRLGGNTGKVNSFSGVGIGALTDDNYDEASILQGNNLACFTIQVMQQLVPDTLVNVPKLLAPALDLLKDNVSPVLDRLACPQLEPYNQGLFNQYPGYKYDPEATPANYRG